MAAFGVASGHLVQPPTKCLQRGGKQTSNRSFAATTAIGWEPDCLVLGGTTTKADLGVISYIT